MIAAYNRSKIIRGVFCLLGSLVCYVLAWLFFRYATALVLDSFGYSTEWAIWLGVIGLLGITWSGFHTWKRGQGFQSYLDSAFFMSLPRWTGPAAGEIIDSQTHRINAPAYVLSQIFLGGPLFALRGYRHFQQLLPSETGLEQKLHSTLGILRQANKWQSINDYPGQEREILMLAQMKHIDFSAHKGTPRFKAPTPDGV
ncbi:MAG: hypothetical protein IPK32_17180 [Verrucomicrobiaceae bacterium]|nr:hypothetical protein [Verrucomicrobiaceae bacterium]